jgi:hypothetical protein
MHRNHIRDRGDMAAELEANPRGWFTGGPNATVGEERLETPILG